MNVPTTTGSCSNAGSCAPWYSTTAITTTASTRFITGPMTRTWNRCHFVFDRNSSDAPVRLFRVLAGHLDVAAERDGADAVFGVAAPDDEQLGAEAERERQHADADPPRHQEMAELVHEDQHAENEQEGEMMVTNSPES